MIVLAMALPTAMAADSLVLHEPATLYDGPSSQATPLLILTAGYPLKEISRVDGWRKVIIDSGDSGWVRELYLRQKPAAIVTADTIVARSSPSPAAPAVFYGRRNLTLDVLGEKNGWVEVLHADGETGYVLFSDVWVNY